MLQIQKTDSSHPDFVALVGHLDAELAIRDGADHGFYAQFNKIDHIKHVVLAFENGIAIGCGAIKNLGEGTMEVKRMYCLPQGRKKGVATGILKELEKWAYEMGHQKCVLETGIKQPEAIALYKKAEYQQIANYGQYAGIENSLCFEKVLNE